MIIITMTDPTCGKMEFQGFSGSWPAFRTQGSRPKIYQCADEAQEDLRKIARKMRGMDIRTEEADAKRRRCNGGK